MSPTKAVQRFTAWSYSRLGDYEACPLCAKFKHLDKLPQGPKGPALQRGIDIHKLAEHYSLGRIKELPDALARFKVEFTHLRGIKERLQVEQQLGLTREWAPSDWFGLACWCRIVMDCTYDVVDRPAPRRIVIDYKTGKINPTHEEQLSLYAIGAFATAPSTIVRVDALLWYLDAGEERGHSFMRDDVPGLKKVWEKRTKKMLADTTFKPKPGNACRWCPYTKAKGGPCVY